MRPDSVAAFNSSKQLTPAGAGDGLGAVADIEFVVHAVQAPLYGAYR